ncbi:ATP-binding protein [Sphingomonas sp. IW22]|uniref:tetratricopeptide repeat-containing sensor histidine kinase n=1 Tax=Sphingomonas sp. IW22 TaxID=3242489 RepID=UPI003520428E
MVALAGAYADSGSPIPEPVATTLGRSRDLMLADTNAAFAQAALAERQALSIGDTRIRREALASARWLGSEALVRNGHGGAALPLTESGALLARLAGKPKLYGDILLARGSIYAQQVRAADALRTYQQAHRAFIAAGDRRGQAIALQSIANLYIDGRDFARADRYFQQAEDAYDSDDMLALALYNNRATGLYGQERYADAITEYDRALRIARARNLIPLQARILGNIVNANIELGKLDIAQRNLSQALSMRARPGGRAARLQVETVAARLALARGNIAEARRWLEAVFTNVDPDETNAAFRQAHVAAVDLYKTTGDDARALAHLEALRRLTDEETRLAASTNTALMAAQFDFANQELRIARLKADELSASVELERSRARFQRTLLFAVAGGAAVIVGLLSFGLVTIRRSRNQVAAANVELERSNHALAKALAAKTEFLATTSHEIRTPLNGILGMTQVMLADRALPLAQRDRVQVVHGAGLTMRALVDDILDVAKMENGNLTVAPEPADLRAALTDVARMWEEQVRAKGLTFECALESAPRWIETDAGRVRQLVSNLLSNALKFTESGSIGLSAMVEEDGRHFSISVRDTGIGIPTHKHGEIFESFKQADSTTTRQYGGTGLGLTICRNLARALGGDISLASDVGTGAVFTVRLPLIVAQAPADLPTARNDDALILLEANPIARSMLRTLLAPRVGEVVAVTTIEAAIAAMDGATRILADFASIGDDDDSRLLALATLSGAAAEWSVATFILWKQPTEAVLQWLARSNRVTLIEKPIAGPALAARLFERKAEGELPLASHAA